MEPTHTTICLIDECNRRHTLPTGIRRHQRHANMHNQHQQTSKQIRSLESLQSQGSSIVKPEKARNAGTTCDVASARIGQSVHGIRVHGDIWRRYRKNKAPWNRCNSKGLQLPTSDPGETRTPDLEIRSHMLYPAELQGQTKHSIVSSSVIANSDARNGFQGANRHLAAGKRKGRRMNPMGRPLRSPSYEEPRGTIRKNL